MEMDFQTEIKCGFCGKYKKDIKKCSRCKLILYCNQECQKNHWKEHKIVCKRLEIKKELKNRELFKIQRPIDEKFEQYLVYNQDKSIKYFIHKEDQDFNEIEKFKENEYIRFYYISQENDKRRYEISNNKF